MIKNKKLLALIPARGGSKRLIGKNTLELAGKPLIAWSIDAAFASKYVDRVIVSTDNKAIADTALKFNAEVPFMRPNHLATDAASSVDVAVNALEYMNDICNEDYGFIILLQPTSPLRTSKHIDAAIEMLIDQGAEGIVSICNKTNSSLDVNPYPYKLSVKNLTNENPNNMHYNVLSKQYKVNGAIYLSKTDVLIRELSFFHDKSYMYVMDKDESIDIDYAADFKLCDLFINRLGVKS